MVKVPDGAKKGSKQLFDWGFGSPPDSFRTKSERDYLKENFPDDYSPTEYELSVIRGVEEIIGVDDL